MANVPWTPAEDDFLRAHAKEPVRWQAKRLGRTHHSINWRRNRLGISSFRTWSRAEQNFLVKNQKMPISDQAAALGRTPSAISEMRGFLAAKGLIEFAYQRPWTDAENALLIERPDLSLRAVAYELNRTERAVSSHVCYLRRTGQHVPVRRGRTPEDWQLCEDEYLIANPDLYACQQAAQLKRAVDTVYRHRKRLIAAGLMRKPRRHTVVPQPGKPNGVPFSADEVDVVRAMLAAGRSRSDIGAALGRTKNSICGFVSRNRATVGGEVRNRDAGAISCKTKGRVQPGLPIISLIAATDATPAQSAGLRNA